MSRKQKGSWPLPVVGPDGGEDGVFGGEFSGEVGGEAFLEDAEVRAGEIFEDAVSAGEPVEFAGVGIAFGADVNFHEGNIDGRVDGPVVFLQREIEYFFVIEDGAVEVARSEEHTSE